MTTAATIKSKMTLDISEYQEGIDKAVESTQQMAEATDEVSDAVKLSKDYMATATKAGTDYAVKYGEIIELSHTGAITFEEAGEMVGGLKEKFEVTGGSIGIFAEQEEKATGKTLDFSKGLGQLAKGLLGMATIYAVGRAVMKFGSDALKAAGAAGKLGKEFDANAKASDRLKLAIGIELGKALKNSTGFLAEFKNEMAENIEKGQEMSEMFEALGYSTEDIARYYGRIRVGLDDAGESYANLTAQVEALGIAEESEMSLAMRQAKGWAERGAALNELGEAMGAMEEQVEDIANVFEGVDIGITNMIESALQLVDWERAGGAEFADKFKAFWEKVVSGAITDETIIDEALQMFEAAGLGLEVAVGEIDWRTAAKRYQEEFGGTIWAANEEIMLNWAAMEIALNDVNFDTIADEISKKLNMPLDEVTAHLFTIIEKMRILDGQVAEATVIITTYEETGVGLPPQPQAGYASSRYQHGGRFFAGQDMIVGEAGIELVTAGVGGQVIPNDALDNSEIVERLESLESTLVNMGQDIITGFELAVS